MRVVLTERGKLKVRAYLGNLKSKRNEILDARKDTASFPMPIMSDVVADINSIADADDYYARWRCTDNYRADSVLDLELGIDFYWEKEKMFKVRLYYEYDDPEHNHRKGDVKSEFFFDSLDDAESLYRGVFEYKLLSYNPTVWKYDEEDGEYVRIRGYC